MKNDSGPRGLTRRDVLRQGIGSAAALILAPVLAGCTLLDARDDDRYVVEISTRSRFEPSGITVPVGSTIAWRNMDDDRHTVTTDPGLLGDPNRVSVPDGAEPWDSGDLMPGDRWSHTLTVPGTYVYACRYHQQDGMVATITVEPEEG